MKIFSLSLVFYPKSFKCLVECSIWVGIFAGNIPETPETP